MYNKIFKENCIPDFYASFDTFYAQKEISNRRNFPSIAAICRFPNILQRLSVPRIMDPFERKRCQKKRKDMYYNLLKELFRKYFVVYECSAVKKFAQYIRYTPDGLF